MVAATVFDGRFQLAALVEGFIEGICQNGCWTDGDGIAAAGCIAPPEGGRRGPSLPLELCAPLPAVPKDVGSGPPPAPSIGAVLDVAVDVEGSVAWFVEDGWCSSSPG